MLKFVLHGIELLVGVIKLVQKVVFLSADQCARMRGVLETVVMS